MSTAVGAPPVPRKGRSNQTSPVIDDGAFPHLFLPAAAGRRTLLLLHGRESDERQLLPLLRASGPGLGALAPRGPEPCGAGWSWWRRLAVGVPAREDLRRRCHELSEWLEEACVRHGLSAPLDVLGYSNGGVMALALVASRPDLIGAATLLRAAYPVPALCTGRGLAGARLLALGGDRDEMLPPRTFEAGVRLYRRAGAHISVHAFAGAGHAITPQDVRALRAWLAG